MMNDSIDSDCIQKQNTPIHESLSSKLEKRCEECSDSLAMAIHVLSDISDMAPDQLEQCLQEEKENHTGERIVLIPYHFENSHWIGILIEFHLDNSVKRAEYIDPVNGQDIIPTQLQEQWNQVYSDTPLQAKTMQKQEDLSSSATLTIENLLASASIRPKTAINGDEKDEPIDSTTSSATVSHEKVNVAENAKNESAFVSAIRSLVHKKDTAKPLDDNLQSMKTDLDTVISSQLTNIQEISTIKDTVSEIRESVVKTRAALTQIKTALDTPNQPLLKSSEFAKLETVNDLDALLATANLSVSWDMNESRVTNKFHECLTQNPPTVSAQYSGTVKYSGNQSYSGSANYTHSISTPVRKCGSCKRENSSSTSGCNLCGAVDKYCSQCGKCFDNTAYFNKTTSEICSKTYSCPGSTSYSGLVPYNGSQSYEGSVEVKCSQEHHKCVCTIWASIVISFREVLEEKEYYKSTVEKQKQLLEKQSERYEEVSTGLDQMTSKMDNINDKGQLALSTIQSERQLFLSELRGQKQKLIIVFSMMNQLHENERNFQEQLLTVVKSNEEEQRDEKHRLQEELTKKELGKLVEVQNIIQYQTELRKEIIEDKKDRESKLSEEKKEKERQLDSERAAKDLLKTEKHDIEKDALTKESKMSMELQKSVHATEIVKQSAEKERAVLDAKLRSFIPNLFTKLCQKCSIDDKKCDNFLEALMDDKIELAQMIKKVEFFMMKEKI